MNGVCYGVRAPKPERFIQGPFFDWHLALPPHIAVDHIAPLADFGKRHIGFRAGAGFAGFFLARGDHAAMCLRAVVWFIAGRRCSHLPGTFAPCLEFVRGRLFLRAPCNR